jgi:hypothetical protein
MIISTLFLQLTSIEYLRKNWGVLVAVGVMYLCFVFMLLLVRYRRSKQSFAYIA